MNLDPNASAAPIALQNGLTHDSHVDCGLSVIQELTARNVAAYLTAYTHPPKEREMEKIAQDARRMAEITIEILNR